MKLATRYLGLKLPHPLIVGASPLADDLGMVRALEDAGAAAITMYSLFEEQIERDMAGSHEFISVHENTFAEAASYFPEVDLLERNADAYLAQLQKIKAAVDIPVIASLNGTRDEDWVQYASLMESAGADALEHNLYFLANDLEESAADIEDKCIRIVRNLKERISIPLALKLSPFYTALPHFAARLWEAKADGLVLFNRFYQPDIDINELEMKPALELSTPQELRLRLRWIALLSSRIPCDYSVTGGVHTGLDAIKAIMAGATSVQLVSSLLRNGPSHIETVRSEMVAWMEEFEYESLETLRGCMDYSRCPDPESLERANYMRVLESWRLREQR